MKSLRLLLIEDSEDDALLLVRELRKGGIEPDFARVDTPQDLEAALDANSWDAVIADYNLPAFTGLDALRIIQAKGLDLPFILVSGVIGEEKAVEAMKAGAHDYIMKGNYPRLAPALERELGDAAVRRERRLAEEALRRAHAELEQRVVERTAELEAANAVLRDSRRAALNMMEDAVVARRQAEEASTELQREVAERKQAVERLREIEERQCLAVSATDLGTWDYDPVTGKLNWDARCKELFGLPSDRVVDYDTFLTGLHPEDREPTHQVVQRTFDPAGGGKFDIEYRTVGLEDGGVFRWIHATGQAYFNESGQAVRFIGTVRDITQRKRTEEELRRAKEAAEAATRAKSQFLANMSHELRTPMTGVLGMLDLALNGPLEAQQREYINIALKSGRSLMRILNDILDLTKIEAGKLSINEEPFALREWAASTVDIFTPEARRKEIEFILCVEDDLPETLVGDQARLRQVLTNLVGNAVKFTTQGKVEVRVAAGCLLDNGKREITFSIVDTGIGIPSDKKQLLFHSFSQLDDSHSRTYGGTGLGLAISKEIVKLIGGTITFDSEYGMGSTFAFTVPLGEAATERETGRVSATSLPVEEKTAVRSEEGKKARLLLAEDDSTIRHLLETMLRLSNFETEIAENGQKAVEMWERGDYDLILMDVQMPLMDGFAASRAIREMEQARGGHTLIVAMTAHALKEDEVRCLEAGMDAYISKPVDLKASIALIKELLSQRDT